jgi:hypothetical protein
VEPFPGIAFRQHRGAHAVDKLHPLWQQNPAGVARGWEFCGRIYANAFGGGHLGKFSANGTLIWIYDLGDFLWPVGPDLFGGVHMAADSASLWRYDSYGNQVWSLSLPAPVNSFVLDPQGNRFVSLTSGALFRLGAEPLTVPIITSAPQGLTVLAGSNAVLNVGATGMAPLGYSWLLNGVRLASSIHRAGSILMARRYA